MLPTLILPVMPPPRQALEAQWPWLVESCPPTVSPLCETSDLPHPEPLSLQISHSLWDSSPRACDFQLFPHPTPRLLFPSQAAGSQHLLHCLESGPAGASGSCLGVKEEGECLAVLPRSGPPMSPASSPLLVLLMSTAGWQGK